MVLKVEGCEVSEFVSVDSLLKNSESLRQDSEIFRDTAVRTVYQYEKCAYIGQREMGILKSSDDCVDIVGSEDATTCHIVIIKESSSSTWGIIHLDSDEENQLKSLIDEYVIINKSELKDIDIYFVGGYADEKDKSRSITEFVMNYLCDAEIVFNLKLLCVGSINTRLTRLASGEQFPAPIHYGVAIYAKKGEIVPAKFLYHGPDKDIRMLQKRNATLVYSSSNGKLVVPAFNYTAYPSAGAWLQVEDDFILHNLSTSPKVEPRHFCEDMRSMFRRMISDPHPLKTIFKNNQDRIYSRNSDTGAWELEDPENFSAGSESQTFNLRDFAATVKNVKH